MTEALDPGPIRVRAGLHTGTPLLTEEGYVGDDVHRAARIAAAGHGGQVLVSAATASLVEVELTDLGEHRFKDLAAPERVYQLGDACVSGAQVAVPDEPAGSGDDVPRPRAGAGRDRGAAQDSARLVTLTGPGGTGKTRLAIQAAAEAADSFQDGIWWVPLSSLRDAHLLVSSIAQALAVEEEPGRDLADSVAARLSAKQALLILDNAEHLMPEIASGIADAPRHRRARRSSSRAASGSSSRASTCTRCRRSRTEDGVELFLDARAGAWLRSRGRPRQSPSSARGSTTCRSRSSSPPPEPSSSRRSSSSSAWRSASTC